MRTFLLFLVCWLTSSTVTRVTAHKLPQLHETLGPGRGSGGFPPVRQCEQGRYAFRDQPALLSGTDPLVASGVPHGPVFFASPCPQDPWLRSPVSPSIRLTPCGATAALCPLTLQWPCRRGHLGSCPPGRGPMVPSLTPRSWLRARWSSCLGWGGGTPGAPSPSAGLTPTLPGLWATAPDGKEPGLSPASRGAGQVTAHTCAAELATQDALGLQAQAGAAGGGGVG